MECHQVRAVRDSAEQTRANRRGAGCSPLVFRAGPSRAKTGSNTLALVRLVGQFGLGAHSPGSNWLRSNSPGGRPRTPLRSSTGLAALPLVRHDVNTAPIGSVQWPRSCWRRQTGPSGSFGSNDAFDRRGWLGWRADLARMSHSSDAGQQDVWLVWRAKSSGTAASAAPVCVVGAMRLARSRPPRPMFDPWRRQSNTLAGSRASGGGGGRAWNSAPNRRSLFRSRQAEGVRGGGQSMGMAREGKKRETTCDGSSGSAAARRPARMSLAEQPDEKRLTA